jgi:hypothetical protein
VYKGKARSSVTPVAEADIEVNAVHYHWDPKDRVRLQAVLVHELGHVLGLDDACRNSWLATGLTHLPPCDQLRADGGPASQSVMFPMFDRAPPEHRLSLGPAERRFLCEVYGPLDGQSEGGVDPIPVRHIGRPTDVLTAEPLRAQRIRVTVDVPRGYKVDDFALEASGKIALDAGSSVQTAQGEPAPIANLAAKQIEMAEGGASARRIVRSRVDVDSAFAWTIDVPGAGTGAVAVVADADLAQAPGAYGAIEVHSGGTLRLRSGRYIVGTLLVEPSGRVVADVSSGPVIIVVLDSVIVQGAAALEPTGPLSKVLLAYVGTANVRMHGSWAGTLLVPNASIDLEPQGTAYHGAIVGRDIRIGSTVQFIFEPFQWASLGLGTSHADHIR